MSGSAGGTGTVVVGLLGGLLAASLGLFLGLQALPADPLGPVTPCQTAPGVQPPPVPVEYEFDRDREALVATYAGAHPLTRDRTEALAFAVVDADAGETPQVSWGDAGGSFPLQPGDAVTVESDDLGGVSPSPDDTVRVFWYGYEVPEHCDGRTVRTAVLDEFRLANATAG